MAEVVAKNAVPWMERQLQQLEVGNEIDSIDFALFALPESAESVCLALPWRLRSHRLEKPGAQIHQSWMIPRNR